MKKRDKRWAACLVALATVAVPRATLADAVGLVMPNGKCIEVRPPDYERVTNGAGIQMWDCHGGPNQQWRVEGSSVVAANGKCLDVRASDFQGRTNGGRVQLWDCHHGPNQQWRIQGATLVSENGKCLDNHTGDFEGRSNGGKLQMWDCNGRPNQQFFAHTVAAGGQNEQFFAHTVSGAHTAILLSGSGASSRKQKRCDDVIRESGAVLDLNGPVRARVVLEAGGTRLEILREPDVHSEETLPNEWSVEHVCGYALGRIAGHSPTVPAVLATGGTTKSYWWVAFPIVAGAVVLAIVIGYFAVSSVNTVVGRISLPPPDGHVAPSVMAPFAAKQSTFRLFRF